MQNSAIFCVLTVVMVLTKSNIGPYKCLYSPYVALVQVPGNHVPCRRAEDRKGMTNGMETQR